MGNGDAGSAGGSGSGRDFGRGVGGSVHAAVRGEGATMRLMNIIGRRPRMDLSIMTASSSTTADREMVVRMCVWVVHLYLHRRGWRRMRRVHVRMIHNICVRIMIWSWVCGCRIREWERGRGPAGRRA